MKKYIIVLSALLFGIGLNAQQDAIDKFFNNYQEDENFTVVQVSPKMFEMFAKVAGDEFDGDLAEVVENLEGLKILTTEVNSGEIYKEALGKINTSEYEELLTVRDKGQNVRFMTKSQGDIINELLLLVGGEKEFVLLSFVGDLNLNTLARLAKKLDIDGAEHLEKLKQE